MDTPSRVSGSAKSANPTSKRVLIEALGVMAGALAILLTLAPTAPFSRELGVCEAGAVRDVLAGNIILPHMVPGPLVHVPPLYWWTVAAWVKFFGWSEFAFRIWSIIPAAATCAIVYAWSSVRICREAALWAAVVLLLGHVFIDAARQPRMDAMLAMFATAAIVSLEEAIRSRRAFWFVAGALAIGLGYLTKSILGIALPGLVIGLFLLMRGRIRELFKPALVAAFTGGLAIGVAWYAAGYAIVGPRLLEFQVGTHLWKRFIPASMGGADYCVHPFWYFVPMVFVGALPWTLYLAPLGTSLWNRRRALPEPIIFALCWFAAILIFFSTSRGKCQVYILPDFAPLAVLIGWTIDRVCTGDAADGTERLFTASSLATGVATVFIVTTAVVAIVHGVPIDWLSHLHPTDRHFVETFLALAQSRDYRVLNWIVLSSLGVLVIVRGLWRGQASFHVFGVLIIAFAMSRFWFGCMNPELAEHETLRGFDREVLNVVPPDRAIGHIGMEDCDIYFYSPRPITPVFHFHCDAASPFPLYIVARKSRYDAMSAAQRACLTPVLISAAVDGEGPRMLLEQSSLRLSVP